MISMNMAPTGNQIIEEVNLFFGLGYVLSPQGDDLIHLEPIRKQ